MVWFIFLKMCLALYPYDIQFLKHFMDCFLSLVTKYKVLENRAKENWEKICSCKVQTYWKLNPDITGKL